MKTINQQPACPVSFILVNEVKVRIIAFQIFVLTGLFLLKSWTIIPAVLAIDFFIRGFTSSPYSLLGQIAKGLVSVLPFQEKPVDIAPKKFAAKIGFIFTLSITVLSILNLQIPFQIMGGVLMFFAFLESAFGICVGCFVYFHLYSPLFIKRKDSLIG